MPNRRGVPNKRGGLGRYLEEKNIPGGVMGFKMRTIMKLSILVMCVGSISIFSQENQIYMSKFGQILTNFSKN